MSCPDLPWCSAPDRYELPDDEVHVWRTQLDLPEAAVASLRSLLSPDERARASRFYSAADRDRFVVGRGALRTILGRYLPGDPSRLDFRVGAYGKPALGEHDRSQPLQFN